MGEVRMDSKRYSFSEEDVHVNKYVARLMLVVAGVCIGALVFNLLDIYAVQNEYMISSTCTVLLLIGVIQALGRVPKFARNPMTKYWIMALVIISTIVLEIMLTFFVVIGLVVPLIVAMSYHSRKLVTMAMVGTMICGFVAPIVGLMLGTWPVSYFTFLAACADLADKDFGRSNSAGLYYLLASNGYVKSAIQDRNTAYTLVIGFVSVPIVAICCIYGIGIRYSIRQKQESYNAQVRHMAATQDTIIRGMSDVVENRDSNTGGHVKRTSEVVAILITKLKQDDSFTEELTDEFCANVVKTAPMHDLGKIAIEDAVLTKAGRLTNEEFAKIKTHPKKSCDIIESIMAGVTDTTLKNTAKNIALYHHEWFNGNGYPSGLSGKDIPLEARIMAIADVYDALVSKRCYKEPMSHERAYKTIQNEMGSHFDPDLWNCFEMAYPELTKYYDDISRA